MFGGLHIDSRGLSLMWRCLSRIKRGNYHEIAQWAGGVLRNLASKNQMPNFVPFFSRHAISFSPSSTTLRVRGAGPSWLAIIGRGSVAGLLWCHLLLAQRGMGASPVASAPPLA